MSHSGQPAGAILVGDFPIDGGQWFPAHRHRAHQLVWGRRGVMAVRVGAATWFLPPTRALWIPAGILHETGAVDPGLLRSPYFRPEGCPVTWSTPSVVAVGPLLSALIDHLAAPDLEPAARARAEAVVCDQLAPLPSATIELAMPRDPRAWAVAEAIIADPTDRRSLAGWGIEANASARTLRRLFLAETGLAFGQWQRRAQLRAALPLLAAGAPVAAAARRAGYATPSAFVAAFRRTVGFPPGALVSPRSERRIASDA